MRKTIILMTLGILAAACNGSDQFAEPAEPPATAVPVQSEPEVVVDEAGPVETAITGILDADSYAFEAAVFLNVGNELLETELEGWVDGDDREMLVKSGGQQLLTQVIDGAATVEREGEVIEVPLTEAAEAPSLTILADIGSLVETDDGVFQGTLTADSLRGSGFDDSTPVTITITLTPDGLLAGYLLESSDSAWSANVKFEDIGESFSG